MESEDIPPEKEKQIETKIIRRPVFVEHTCLVM